jgi:hypothetical protein
MQRKLAAKAVWRVWGTTLSPRKFLECEPWRMPLASIPGADCASLPSPHGLLMGSSRTGTTWPASLMRSCRWPPPAVPHSLIVGASASPSQNGFAERMIGSIRRECVDHLIVLGEAAFASDLASLCWLLQRHPHALVLGKRCTVFSAHSADWRHPVKRHPCRAPSTLRPGLGFRYRQAPGSARKGPSKTKGFQLVESFVLTLRQEDLTNAWVVCGWEGCPSASLCC